MISQQNALSLPTGWDAVLGASRIEQLHEPSPRCAPPQGRGHSMLAPTRQLLPLLLFPQVTALPQHKYSTWLGGSIPASLSTFQLMWSPRMWPRRSTMRPAARVHRKRFWALAPGPLPASPPSSPWAGTGRSPAWERSWKAPSVTLRGLEGTSPAHNFPAVGTDMNYPSSGPLSLRVEGRGSWSLRDKEYSDAVKYREGRNPAALIRLPHRYWASCVTPQMSGAAAPGVGVSLGCKAGAPRETSDLYPGFWKVVRAHASGLGSLFWLLAPDAPRFLGPEAAFTGRSVGPSQPRGSQHLGPKL